MRQSKKFAAYLMISVLATGCETTAGGKYNGVPPSFNEGMEAIQAKDFVKASYHFSRLSGDGDPGAMNNLAVALLMVDRRDDAVYWFKQAARSGSPDGAENLRKMGIPVPPADRVKPVQQESSSDAMQTFVAAVAVGALLGLSAYYGGKASAPAYNFQQQASQFRSPVQPSVIPLSRTTPTSPQLIQLQSGGQAITGQRLGNITYYSNGVTQITSGNFSSFSNGQTATQSGSLTTYSNGATSNTIGNQTIFSNGQVCNRLGAQMICQ